MKFTVVDHDDGQYGEQVSRLRTKTPRSEETLHRAALDTRAGSLALDEAGTVIAWMGVQEVRDEIWGNHSRFSTLYDGERMTRSAVLKVLYGAEIEKLQDESYEHWVLCSALDLFQLSVWIELGFGYQQAYGSVALEQLQKASQPWSRVTVGPLTDQNREEFLKFSSLIAGEQAKAPILAGAPDEYHRELRKGFEELTEDGQAITLLASLEGRVVGYQVWLPVDDRSIELTVSGTVADQRGQGVGTALTNRGAALALARGFQGCVTDWRTANPWASSFWPSLGFTVDRYRLVRRLNENAVADAKRRRD